MTPEQEATGNKLDLELEAQNSKYLDFFRVNILRGKRGVSFTHEVRTVDVCESDGNSILVRIQGVNKADLYPEEEYTINTWGLSNYGVKRKSSKSTTGEEIWGTLDTTLDINTKGIKDSAEEFKYVCGKVKELYQWVLNVSLKQPSS